LLHKKECVVIAKGRRDDCEYLEQLVP